MCADLVAAPLEMFPRASAALGGSERLGARLRFLLVAVEQRWQGRGRVTDQSGALLATLRCQAGWVMAGHVPSATDLHEATVGICCRLDAIISLAEGLDLVGSGPEILCDA